jgi:hypothetical protein
MYARIAQIAFWVGVFFTVLEIVYGYFFNVWVTLNQELTARAGMSMNTKFSEMVLFAFLSIASFLISISASLIKTQSPPR